MAEKTVQLSQIAQQWKDKGQKLVVPSGGADSFIWREGSGPTVVCIHGVPASAFLYRKVISALSERDLEGVVIDLPGLGFADRPEDFDYSWSGLADWYVKALDAAGIDKFHLCVHDIGGPIGFDIIRRIPDRILSLTVLNTLVNVDGFSKPWIMKPFEYRFLGEFSAKFMSTAMVIPLMRFKGVLGTPSNAELRVYGELLGLGDEGRAFLKIMRSFNTNKAFQDGIHGALKTRAFPAQVVFGKFDTALSPVPFAQELCEILKIPKYFSVQGRHFIQEDCWDEIANHISDLVKSGKDRSPA